jgi:hypothetical protein
MDRQFDHATEHRDKGPDEEAVAELRDSASANPGDPRIHNAEADVTLSNRPSKRGSEEPSRDDRGPKNAIVQKCRPEILAQSHIPVRTDDFLVCGAALLIASRMIKLIMFP